LNASADQAKALGYETTVIENGLFGESRERGYELAGKARKRSQERPSCLLAGGETAVTVRGNGRGGRNQELALAALCEMVEADEWLVASCSTDGEDGETAAAGAFADTTVRTEAIRKNMDPRVYLERNDSHSFFALTNGLIETGPSETNVMDIALLLTAGRKQS
jgi:glycerate-2-kinase